MFRSLRIATSILAFAACGPKTLPPESPLDTPDNHYRRGLAKIEQGDLMMAQSEFERARALDTDFPGWHVGYALVAIEQGEFWTARQEIEQAIHMDNDFADAYIARGRLLTTEGTQRGYAVDDWLKKAQRAYSKAISLRPQDAAAYYHRGITFLKARELAAAAESFGHVLEMNSGPLVEPSMRQVERIQMVLRAAPGSEWGIQIGLVERITRAELAVLLLEELQLSKLIHQRRPPKTGQSFAPPGDVNPKKLLPPEDIAGSWALPWIEEVLTLGVPGLELMPDTSFRPDEPITRANYARVNEGILTLITGDRRLSTKYVGDPSPFPDVRGDSYAYNAIALNVDRGIMAADKITGRFRPQETVSGAEALLIIRELQNAVRMEF